MDTTGISMHMVVRVNLTPYGRSVYKAYMDAEAGPDRDPRVKQRVEKTDDDSEDIPF